MSFPYDRPDRLGRPSRFQKYFYTIRTIEAIAVFHNMGLDNLRASEPCKPREKIEFYEIVNAMGM